MFQPPPKIIQSLLKLRAEGHLDEARQQLQTLKREYEASYEIHAIAGAVDQELGLLEEATQNWAQATELRPNEAEAHYNLALALNRCGRPEASIESYRKAINLKPELVPALMNLGQLLKKQGDTTAAIRLFHRAIHIKPDNSEIYFNLGSAHDSENDLETAEICYQKALEFNPRHHGSLMNLASVVRRTEGNYAKAIEMISQAAQIEPNNYEIQYNLGLALAAAGQLDEAKEAHRNAIAIQPDYGPAHRVLSSMTKFSNLNDPHFQHMRRSLETPALSKDDRIHLGFALAKASEDLGELEEAFNLYEESNRLRKEQTGYSIDHDRERFRRIKQAAESITQFKPKIDSDPDIPTPIFIVGMPRSGTTLIEQIISAHPLVEAGGELPFAGIFGDRLATGSVLCSEANLLEFRDNYLNRASKRAGHHAYITDKMPHNFAYLPLIKSAIPEAKIVHVQRDPAATCWSNFRLHLSGLGLRYTNDLNDTVTYFRLYSKLMEHWRSVLPGCFYDIDYERLTTEQESETKHLIQGIGLKWADECLRPEQNKRVANTFSRHQVTQKVYPGSSKEWLKFKPFIKDRFEPLKKLGASLDD